MTHLPMRVIRAMAALLASFALASCGGGDDETPSEGSAASTDARESALASTAAGEPTWTRVADEGQAFTVSGVQTVRYGAGASWVQRSISHTAQCSNSTFGSDPAYDIGKSCQVRDIASLPVPVEPSARIAVEGQAFTVSGTQVVRYGVDTRWVQHSVTNAGQCTNAFFGSDPAREVAKACEVLTGATTGGRIVYIAAGGSGSACTQSAPCAMPNSGGVNALPVGSQLLFRRGDTIPFPHLILDNRNATPARPLVFAAYGTGADPVLQAGSEGIWFGAYANAVLDGGYTFENLRLRGTNPEGTGMFLQSVRNLTLRAVTIENFAIGIASQDNSATPVSGLHIVNSSISRNGSMGLLGQFRDSVIEGTTFEHNNFSGSGFNHGTYISGKDGTSGINIILRNNRYIHNSVVNEVCQGGNMTFHGQLTNVLIEGNLIEQDASASGCWGMSITQGYDTAEWFRSFVVRGNEFILLGGNAMNAQSAPGIVVEDNVVINTQSNQVGLSVGHREYQNGDVLDGNAVVRNNTGCYPGPGTGNTLLNITAPSSTVSNNVTLTGIAATQGICVH